MANRVRKCVYLYVFGHSRQLSLNKFFDLSNTFMKEVDDGGEKHGKKWEGGDRVWETKENNDGYGGH